MDLFDDRFINSVRTVRLPTLRIMLTRTSDHGSVVDGGADTMVLSTGWGLLEIFEHRKVNIVGFDEADARKYGCNIGTALSVMTDVTSTDYLMVAHEAVENRRSRTPLLSEGQMYHFGLIVDSNSKRHRGIDGHPGTQSLYSPHKSIQFQMQQRDALMILPYHAPSDNEIDTLPRFHISDVKPWSPTLLHDDDDATTSLAHDLESGPTCTFHINNMLPASVPSTGYVSMTIQPLRVVTFLSILTLIFLISLIWMSSPPRGNVLSTFQSLKLSFHYLLCIVSLNPSNRQP
jgi:hypothetical protein